MTTTTIEITFIPVILLGKKLDLDLITTEKQNNHDDVVEKYSNLLSYDRCNDVSCCCRTRAS